MTSQVVVVLMVNIISCIPYLHMFLTNNCLCLTLSL
jgi:hypothetical protein